MPTTTVLTNTGKRIVMHRLKGDAGWNVPQYLGWGTGAGTAAPTDTTLFTEASEARVACTLAILTTSTTEDTFQALGTLTASGAKTITNAGIFDASTGGNLFLKASHDGIPLDANDSIQYDFRWRL